MGESLNILQQEHNYKDQRRHFKEWNEILKSYNIHIKTEEDVIE